MYMRQASLYPYIKNLDTKGCVIFFRFKLAEQYVYGGDVAIKTKYMGKGISNILLYFCALDIEYYGIKKTLGCAINKAAQAMYDNKPYSKVKKMKYKLDYK